MNEENNNVKLRPMMKISEMVPYLKTKNIKFELISEDKAEKYLRDNNNYYNYLAGIEASCKVYLTLDQGLNGIKIYLDNHKSPFFK